MIYSAIINLRNLYYDIFKPKPLDFPVISVGAIRAGGSGKTPFADWVIAKIEETGKTPVLLSRGYGRKSRQTEIVPPDNETDWETVGDEPLMLKSHNKNLWLAIDGNRSRAEKKLRSFNLKNIVGIMDDGFQHRKFPRNLDIVIITSNDLKDKMLPFGRLREPVKSLERADIVISPEFEAGEFINAVSGERKTGFDEEVLCFCGIARPERFLKSVNNLTGKTNKYLFFGDHHQYSKKDYNIINSASQAAFVTTEKDFFRLNTKKMENMNKLWYLSYRVRICDESCKSLKNKIFEICGVKNE